MELKRSVWTAFGDISANLCQGILVVFFIGTFLSDNPQYTLNIKMGREFYILFI